MARAVGDDDDGGSLRIERTAKTLRELALEKMREAIMRFSFRPGDRLIERDLCERLGVSRSVVRECLRHLEAEGLVETIPHHGPIVARFDPEKVEQIYEIRAMLEAMAARACAESAPADSIDELGRVIDGIEAAFRDQDPPAILEATTTFYDILFLAAGKKVAWEIVRSLNARINHLRAMTISSAGRDRDAIAEMRRIHAAIRARDAEAAHAAALDHVQVVARIARSCMDTGTAGAG